MSGLEIAFGVVLLVFAVGIIAVVLLQEGHTRSRVRRLENTRSRVRDLPIPFCPSIKAARLMRF